MQYLWLCLVCLILAAIFIAVEKSERYVLADAIKGAASALFVLVGLLSSQLASPQADQTYIQLILLGLAIGAVADVILNLRYVFEGTQGKVAFLGGILIFLAGHIAYLLAVSRTCPMLKVFIAIGLVLTGALMMWIFSRIEASLVFKIFGVFYIGAITVMNTVALGSMLANPTAHTLTFLAGAILFLISDLALIINTFGPTKHFSLRIANLMLYYVGQLLIALSLQLL